MVVIVPVAIPRIPGLDDSKLHKWLAIASQLISSSEFIWCSIIALESKQVEVVLIYIMLALTWLWCYLSCIAHASSGFSNSHFLLVFIIIEVCPPSSTIAGASKYACRSGLATVVEVSVDGLIVWLKVAKPLKAASISRAFTRIVFPKKNNDTDAKALKTFLCISSWYFFGCTDAFSLDMLFTYLWFEEYPNEWHDKMRKRSKQAMYFISLCLCCLSLASIGYLLWEADTKFTFNKYFYDWIIIE